MIITYVKPSAGENEVFIGGSEGEKYRISVADARRAGIYKFLENPELLPEEADGEMLEFMSKKLSCISYAAYLLEFGDKSKKALTLKLKTKGFDADVCEAALAVLEANGIVDDERLCSTKLEALARTKLYGPYRLKQELLKKGFSSKQIEIAFDEAELDFDEMLESLAEKLSFRLDLDDEKNVVALKNKLLRYGYSYDSVADVMDKYID